MFCLPTAGLLAQGQYDLDPLPPFPDHVQYTHYSDQIGKASPTSPDVPPALATSLGVHGSARDQGGRVMGISAGVVLGSPVTSFAPGAGN